MAPEPYCTVVLDTGPVRDLAHSSNIPQWVSSFAAMRGDGYRFSLADQGGAELLNQKRRGSISDEGFQAILTCLETFLDPIFPLMLGEIDVMVMIGATPADRLHESSASASVRAWDLFRNQRVGFFEIDEMLEEERATWRSMFERLDRKDNAQPFSEYDDPQLQAAFVYMDEQTIILPPLSVRLDLKIRYAWRQFVRSKKARGRYNVNAPKKRNDGIDFGVYTYLALPSFIVSNDRGFKAGVQDIPSFQKDWIFTPSELAEAWLRGDRPRPIWPA